MYPRKRSHGLFAGVALDGAVLVTRAGDNAAVYGRVVIVVSHLRSGLVARTVLEYVDPATGRN